jgi:hypothetical protein
VTGIEPALSAWEADVLPLNYTRSDPPERGRRHFSKDLLGNVTPVRVRPERPVDAGQPRAAAGRSITQATARPTTCMIVSTTPVDVEVAAMRAPTE